MPRSFLISNKRYRQKTDRNHNVSKSSEDESAKTKRLEDCPCVQHLHPDKEHTPEHDSIKQDEPYQNQLEHMNRYVPPTLSYRTLLPIDHRFCTKDIDHDNEALLDKPMYYRPLHHIFRQMHTGDVYFQTLSNLGLQKAPYEGVSFDRLNALVDKVFDEINLCEVYHCEECGKGYSTSSNLARHRQIHRDINDKKARKCPHCEKVYVSMPAFSMHVRTHSQGCVCPYCGKRFSRPWLLQGHIRTHTGEKPFKCPKCAKAFADKSNLRAHIQTHSTEKPYTCGRCGKAFALKSYLSKHEESSCMRGLKYHKLHCTFAQG